MSKVKINRVDITIAAQNKPVNTENIDIDQKSARDGMASDKLNDISECAVSKSHNAYDILDLKIDDADKIKDN